VRNTLLLLGLLALLGVGAWFFVYRPDSSDGFDPEEAGFAIRDTAVIGRIFLADPHGGRVDLRRTRSGWMLDGKYPALPAMMQQLMHTLYNQRAAAPVSKSAHNMVVTGLSSNHVKAEVFDTTGKRMRSFYVGGEVEGFNGTYMLMDGAKRPYVITLSSFEGYLTPRYSTSWYDWRDRTVFNIPADRVQSVAVTYEVDTLRSFRISRTAAGVVATMPGTPPPAASNENRAKTYLGFFQNVNAEGYLNGRTGMTENFAASRRKCLVEVATTAGDTQRIAVWYVPFYERSKNGLEPIGQFGDFDADRYYAVMNGGRDTVFIQQQAFEKIFRDGPEFFAPDRPRATAAR